MIYLLDSNVWITVLRRPTSELARRFRSERPADIRTCSIVVAELRHGCLRSAKPAENRSAVDSLVAPVCSLAFDDDAAEHIVRIRHDLEQAGCVIGPYDMQIAAIARANGHTLVSHNTSEFGRVPGLSIEDWQVP